MDQFTYLRKKEVARMNHPIGLAPAVLLQVLAISPKTEVIKSQLSIYPDFVKLLRQDNVPQGRPEMKPPVKTEGAFESIQISYVKLSGHPLLALPHDS